jgi:hypothetical protein
MNRIAKETGGTHIDTEITDPHTYFRQIAEELRTSYELAYNPTNTAKDDTFRKVVVSAREMPASSSKIQLQVHLRLS